MRTDATPPFRVAHLDTGRRWRGGQVQVLHLMRGLAARQVRSCLLAPRGPLLERARATGIETVAWAPRGDLDLPALIRAAHLLRSRPVALAHCHDARAHALGVPAARLAGVPVVVVSRRTDFAVGRHPLSALKYRLPVDRYLCVSRGVMESMVRGGVPAERLVLVPSGIERPPATAADLRALIGVAAAAPLVGTVAALTPEKGHLVLLEAAARVTQVMHDVHFVWLGEGPERAVLERRRDRLGLGGRVHLLGFRPDAAGLAAQLTVLASASLAEGLGTALLEAQAHGVPVVATAVGGVPEIVADGVTGRLVPPGDAGAMAMALLELLGDPHLGRTLGESGRQAVQAFGIDQTVDRTLAVYCAALAHRRASGTKPA